MQNWNQWQLPTGAITTSMPQPPVGYTAPGADPMAMMQAYMQYYNQPAPSGYTAEQWAAAQQQNWTQWQQWQQQYQQWQAQYGEKYQETMKQMSSQNMNLSGHAPPLPTMPPLPKEDFKPPLPPNTVNTYQFTNIPPPHQNNLPLFPAKQPVSSAASQLNVNSSQNPPLPPTQPPLPLESAQNNDSNSATKRSSNAVSESCSAKKLKLEDEELTEAEKTFDAQFKQWEEQFNKWKQQNANHPDKTHYKIYEAKWTSWREKLIERREQMRKKREQQKQTTAKADPEKNKNLPGGDKIMNILSSTENQGLINNLLGIGKTLGLTGKQNTGTLPPPPPPPQTTSNISSTTVTPAITSQQSTSQPLNSDTVSSWNAQQAAQWAAQFNSGMQNYNSFHGNSGSTQPSFGTSLNSTHPPNFALPPPNVPNVGPNFLQPPPGFNNNDGRQLPDASVRQNLQDRSSYGSSGNNLNMFGANERANSEINRFGSNEPLTLPDYSGNFDTTDNTNNERMNNRKGQLGTGPEYFRREILDKNLSEHDQFRSDGSFNYGNARFGRGEENYKSIDGTEIDGKLYKPEDRNYMERGNNQFNDQNSFNSVNSLNNDHFNIDRTGPGPGDRFVGSGDRFGAGSDRFGNSNDRYNDRFGSGDDRFIDRFGSRDRFGSNNVRFGSSSDRFGSLDRFGSSNDRFTSRNERFGQGNGLECDRFGPGFDRFGVSSDNVGPGNNRFGRNIMDHYEGNEGIDSTRDSNNSRNFDRNNQFGPTDELAPELKKLMEKRRAAMDVFKPSFHDTDKSVNVGSLRESFKKIAGDSPFISKSSTDFGQRDYVGSRGMAVSSPRFPGNFGPQNNPRSFGPRGPNEFKSHGNFEFRLRAHTNFSPRDNFFDSHDPGGPFLRESNTNFSKFDKNHSMFGSVDVDQRIEQQFDRGDPKLQQTKDTQNSGSSDNIVPANTDNILTEKRSDIPVNKNEMDNVVKAEEVSQTEKIGEESSNNIADAQSNAQEDKATRSNVPPLEKPPWMDASFPDVNLSEKDINNTECNNNPPANFVVASTEENNEKADDRIQTDLDKKLESDAPDNEQVKKSEVLPFMGENDPKPEDLNMEPPPELPNLGTITDDLNNDNNTFANNQKIKEPFGADRNFSGEFERNAKYFDPKNTFSPRGPNDGRFLQQPHTPNNGQFSSLGSNDIRFRSRASSDGQFGFRGSNNRNYGPWRTNEMPCDNRGFTDTQFAPRGPIDRLSGITNINERNFNNRRSMDGPFDNQCSNDGPFTSGYNDGQFSHHNQQDRMLGSRSFAERHFDIRNAGSNSKPFGSRGPFEDPFESQGLNNEAAGTRNYNDRLCSNRSPFANRAFGSDGALDSANNDIFKDKFNENYLDRKLDIGITDTGGSVGSKLNCELGKVNKSDGKTSFFQSNFSDNTSRLQYGSDCTVNLPPHEFKSNIHSQVSPFDKKITEKSCIESNVGDSRIGYGDISGGLDYKYTNSPFMKRSIDNHQSYMRGVPNKEFCIERQFNYNHGGATKDKKYIEHVPVKVIDYAHAPRTIMQEHLTPVQCFDYGHGKLKPVVPDHELIPQRDFRNWEESEQNLKEYAEKMKKYENSMMKHEHRRNTNINETRESDWIVNIRKYEREKRNTDDMQKDRECSQEERVYTNTSDKERDECIQSDNKINDKDRGHERCERVQTDINKENDRDNDRSKGRTNWQENSNKNTVETKSSNTSFTDKQQNVSELPSKTLELAKTANCTMVDDLLCPPGRQNRPSKIAIILRGPPGSGKSFVAKLIKDKEVEQGGSAPRILSLDDYFLVEKEIETKDDNGKKVIVKEMVYEYEEAMEPSYIASLVKAFKKNITDGFFNFIILDCINEKISDYEDMWSFAKSKGFKVYVCEMEMDVQICLKRNIHNRSEDEINRIVDYFEPTPSYHQKLDVNSMLQEQAIEEVQMEDSQETSDKVLQSNEESQDSQDDAPEIIGISKWERMEAEDKLDRLDGLAKKKNEGKPQTMEDFLQVPDYYNMEDTSGKKRVRWADLEERKQQEKMRAVGFVVGHTNWDRMMDPTKGGSALTRTKYI